MSTSQDPEELVERAREFIESSENHSPEVRGRYPVEYDPIRRYCNAADMTFPLFLDREYAAQTTYGEVICPPLFIGYFAAPGTWPPIDSVPDPQRGRGTFIAVGPRLPAPGDRPINLVMEYEFFEPVRVGDRLSVSGRLVDAFLKPIRLDSQAFWRITEREVRNQDGTVVAKVRNTALSYRQPESDDSS